MIESPVPAYEISVPRDGVHLTADTAALALSKLRNVLAYHPVAVVTDEKGRAVSVPELIRRADEDRNPKGQRG